MTINRRNRSDTETIEGPAAALERVNNIKSGDSFPFRVLGVGYRVADDLEEKVRVENYVERMATYTLEEVFQYSTSFLVDETRDTLDTTTTSEAANSRFGNALDVVAQDFAMALSTGLSETLATFSTASCSNACQ